MAAVVERVELPGIGVRHDVLTSSGRRVSVVSLHTGGRELAVARRDDPDASSVSVPLTDSEASALAEVLGASLVLGQLAGLREQATGLHTDLVAVPVESPYVDRPLGDTRTRTRTGVSIVAILREGGEVIPAPGPGTPLAAGDTLVAVGTPAGMERFARLISDDLS